MRHQQSEFQSSFNWIVEEEEEKKHVGPLSLICDKVKLLDFLIKKKEENLVSRLDLTR